jgi:hypothetical protein
MTEGFVADRPEFEWLTEKAGGWQFGEQGILVALANVINQPGQCVEIGAGDGESLPLTIDPFYNYGLDCVLYEMEAESLEKLQAKYPKATHNGEFKWGEQHALQAEPLVAVIDVDGWDSLLMQDVLQACTPLMLMVEHFDKFHPSNCDQVEGVPDWLLGQKIDGGFSIQDNAATLNALAEQYNYTRLGTTRVNSIFVHDSLVEKVTKHVPV